MKWQQQLISKILNFYILAISGINKTVKIKGYIYRFILKQFKNLFTPLYLLFKKIELMFKTIEIKF